MLDNIFDYIKFLQRRAMIGQMHPTDKHDQSAPIIALLVPLDVAINECTWWSGQDITRSEFQRYLSDCNVHVFNTIDDFVNEKERTLKKVPRKTKRLLEIVDELNISKERIEYSSGHGRFLIVGKNGYVHDEGLLTHVHVLGRSKRHWSSIKRKLSFMRLIKNESKGGLFVFDSVPDSDQATAIRNIVGMSKCHTISNEHKEALRHHAAAIRENIGAHVLEIA